MIESAMLLVDLVKSKIKLLIQSLSDILGFLVAKRKKK